ncbi:MAG: DUF3015 domain-containing protein [Nitrospirae bacterium]|nr:MAG: DUF3015 domain-containing protein [Nitrospirota bacterium]
MAGGDNFWTSGCTNDGKVWAEHDTEFFVPATFENLVGDMARGQGEHPTALAILLGVSTDHQRCSFRWYRNAIVSSLAMESTRRALSSKR